MSMNCPKCGFLNPDDADYCEKCGQPQKIRYNPKLAKQHFGRGFELAMARNYNSAIEEYTYAINFDDINSQYYYHRGFSYIKIGNLYKGREDFIKSIKLNPNYAFPHLELGKEYFFEGNYDYALYHLNKAIDLKKQFTPVLLAEAYFYRAVTYNMKGKRKNFMNDLEKAKKIDPLIQQRVENKI